MVRFMLHNIIIIYISTIKTNLLHVVVINKINMK